MAKATKQQLKDIGITEKEAKHYGMAYSLEKELEKTLEDNKKDFKTKMQLAFGKIPDKEKCNYENAFTLAGIKFGLSIPMVTDKEKMKSFLKKNLSKEEYKRAVTVKAAYEIDRDKLYGNKALVKSLIDSGVLVRKDDDIVINDNVVDELVNTGVLVQADIDKECKSEGSPTLRLSGKGLTEMKEKAAKWIEARFDL